MLITVLYFAQIRLAAGCASENLEVPPGTSVADLLVLLSARHAGLQDHLRVVLCSRNEVWVPRSAQVSAGDRIGVMPPVGGG